MKTTSLFYPARLREHIEQNAKRYEWAADIRKTIIDDAQHWYGLSDDELWGLMFAPTIKRSWMVLSGGFCPACRQDVTMYNWVMDGQNHPWKTKCPHCSELFPKNDFAAYYRSGLDRQGLFQPEAADRTLLFHTDHPDPDDPLNQFGVDDGDGFIDAESGKRWRFVGAYLIYGHWKQLIVRGIEKLANAYVATGDVVYARKAAILLDRVADLYPTFDFGEQGILYEKKGHSGYVSTWHDANMETREMALGYDKIFDAMKGDAELVTFLSRKAREIGLENPKSSFADIQRNIEERIFRDALANRPKVTFNFPLTDTLMAIMRTVLDWPHEKAAIMEHIDATIAKAVSVDGVTGEKGLANYSALTINHFSEFMALYDRMDPTFLRESFEKHPQLVQTWKFFIDTWCLEKYYPLTGDSGAFALPVERYRGVMFENFEKLDGISGNRRTNVVDPSMYSFMWSLYMLTGDADYVKVMYKSNGYRTDQLPYELAAGDPEAVQEGVRSVIAREGEKLEQRSVNKEQWHLAILRAGNGDNRRALWLDYDSGFAHGHSDGMNLGLFVKGLDLMPECGYPPVQFEGAWQGPKAKWYGMTAAHNTVVVDGVNHKREVAGQTTLWADTETSRVVRASGPELVEAAAQYERTVALTDMSEADSYVIDVFRVVGGRDHAKFMHSHFGTVTTFGLKLEPADDYGNGTQMRNFQGDTDPQPGWSVDWTITDEYGLLSEGSADVHLRYTDLTAGAHAYIAEGWVNAGSAGVKKERWIPRVMVRRQAESEPAPAAAEPLVSTFVAVIEPYERQSGISSIKRLTLTDAKGEALSPADVAVEVGLTDGRVDLHLALDAEDPLGLKRSGTGVAVQPDWDVELDGEYAVLRRRGPAIERILLGNARSLRIGSLRVELRAKTEVVELVLQDGQYQVVSGNPDDVSLQ
jgi:Zn ribbon nucleic-acid-binding protein